MRRRSKECPMIKLILAATAAIVLAAAPGCKKHEPANKTTTAPAAQPSATTPAPLAPPPKPGAAPAAPGATAQAPLPSAPGNNDMIPAGTYTIDNIHSNVILKSRHFGAGNVYGWFKEFEGKFVVGKEPAQSSVEVTVKTASVDTRVEKRDTHLKSPDFFNAAQFPTATFKSTRISKNGDGTWNIAGDFTMRGKTKSVTAKGVALGTGTNPMKKQIAGFEAKLTINRHDFDVSFMRGAIGDDIEITIALEGMMQ